MRNTEGQDLRKTPSQVALVVKHLPVSASDLTLGFDSWVMKILGGGGESHKATHSSIFAWRIPWTEEPGEPLRCEELDRTEAI